jgi:hypothetical protein
MSRHRPAGDALMRAGNDAPATLRSRASRTPTRGRPRNGLEIGEWRSETVNLAPKPGFPDNRDTRTRGVGTRFCTEVQQRHRNSGVGEWKRSGSSAPIRLRNLYLHTTSGPRIGFGRADRRMEIFRMEKSSPRCHVCSLLVVVTHNSVRVCRDFNRQRNTQACLP